LRGALIPELVPDDVELLVRKVGLRTVVDLRTAMEVQAVPGRWAEHQITWVHCPIHLGRREPVGDRIDDYALAYFDYLTTDPEPALLAVETLMTPASQPALFHCAAGKDRTGVVAAVLLDVLGVAHETIAEDYALTVHALPAIIERLAALPPYRALQTASLEDHIPEAETMRRFLARLTAELGGGAGWLAGHGIARRTLDEFRATMLTAREAR
jgi:hypothetical protein